MFSLTISIDDAYKLACVASAIEITISPGDAPANIADTNEWYLQCLEDSLGDVVAVHVEDIIGQLRRCADSIETQLRERTEEV